jgi:hypothetical protein
MYWQWQWIPRTKGMEKLLKSPTKNHTIQCWSLHGCFAATPFSSCNNNTKELVTWQCIQDALSISTSTSTSSLLPSLQNLDVVTLGVTNVFNGNPFHLYDCLTVWLFKCSNVQMFKCSDVQMFKCSNVRMFDCSTVRLFNCSTVQLFNCSTVNCWGLFYCKLLGIILYHLYCTINYIIHCTLAAVMDY